MAAKKEKTTYYSMEMRVADFIKKIPPTIARRPHLWRIVDSYVGKEYVVFLEYDGSTYQHDNTHFPITPDMRLQDIAKAVQERELAKKNGT